ELLAFDALGRSALAALGLAARPDCGFIATQMSEPGMQARRIAQGLSKRGIASHPLPGAATLWDEQSPAGYSCNFVAGEALLIIVAAPSGPSAVDLQYTASELRVVVQRANPSPLLVP